MARKLSAYNRFVKKHAKKGLSMAKIADLWRKTKKGTKKRVVRKARSTARKIVRRRKRTMPKRKKSYRRRSNPMGSYSKSNIALGTLLGAVAPRFVPGASQFLPIAALLPKAPTALKIMGWTLASKTITDRYLTR